MAKHSFPYKPICFKCKTASARAHIRIHAHMHIHTTYTHTHTYQREWRKKKTRWVNEVRGGRVEVMKGRREGGKGEAGG